MLNANLTSAKKITKVIKQSIKLVLSIWQGQGLDKLPTGQDQEAPEQETSKSQDQERKAYYFNGNTKRTY